METKRGKTDRKNRYPEILSQTKKCAACIRNKKALGIAGKDDGITAISRKQRSSKEL